jgi:uncharacterized membrane protein YeaQ/YmgE (transglycosylase-associated protein family)
MEIEIIIQVIERMSTTRILLLGFVSGLIARHVFGQSFRSGALLGLWLGILS